MREGGKLPHNSHPCWQVLMKQPIKGSILVIDDDPASVNLAGIHLRRAGFEVSLVGDGETALERVQEDIPSLVLLDIRLPGMDGYEVCRQLKQNQNTRSIPIIILSASRNRENVLEALEAGADDFLAKPIDPETLIHKVSSFKFDNGVEKSAEEAAADNRRQYIRFQLEAEAVLHLDLQVIDLSEGGVGLLSNNPVLPGSTIQVKFGFLAELVDVQEIPVKIRYCVLSPNKDRYRIGGEFLGLGEPERKKIRQFIFKRQLQRARPRD